MAADGSVKTLKSIALEVRIIEFLVRYGRVWHSYALFEASLATSCTDMGKEIASGW